MYLNDRIGVLIFGLVLLITGYFLYSKEKKKPNLKLNSFLGYKFFKNYGIILMFFGIFLLFIAIHSMIYR